VQHHAIYIILQLHAPGTAGQRAARTDGAVIAGKIGGAPKVERFPDELIGRPANLRSMLCHHAFP
jgi:hypothetical protein